MSPSTERVAAGPATERTPQTERVRGLTPSREQRLHRIVAVAPPSADDIVERSDDETDLDPYVEIPEELEPDDPDEPTSIPALADGTGQRRSIPSISFSMFSGWARGDRTSSQVPATSTSVPGLRISVAHTAATGADRDVVAAADADDDLDAIAAAIGETQYAAVTASRSAEAFDALVPLTQRKLAEMAGLDESAVSRRRRIVVECPWGLVPLEFFCWKKSASSLRASDARALAKTLLAEPTISDLAAARRVAETLRHKPDDVRRLADSMRQQVRVLRVLIDQLPMVNGMAAALTTVDLDELEATLNESVETALGSPLTARGKGLVRLGLAGAFAGLVSA